MELNLHIKSIVSLLLFWTERLISSWLDLCTAAAVTFNAVSAVSPVKWVQAILVFQSMYQQIRQVMLPLSLSTHYHIRVLHKCIH